MSDYSRPYTDADAEFDERKTRVIDRIKLLKVKNLNVDELLKIIGVFRGEKYYPVSIDLESNVDMLEGILEDHNG